MSNRAIEERWFWVILHSLNFTTSIDQEEPQWAYLIIPSISWTGNTNEDWYKWSLWISWILVVIISFIITQPLSHRHPFFFPAFHRQERCIMREKNSLERGIRGTRSRKEINVIICKFIDKVKYRKRKGMQKIYIIVLIIFTRSSSPFMSALGTWRSAMTQRRSPTSRTPASSWSKRSCPSWAPPLTWTTAAILSPSRNLSDPPRIDTPWVVEP